MKHRVDFAICAENGRLLCELSAAGESLEGAIVSAMIAAAPHLSEGREVVVIRAGYLCRCGRYHPVSDAISESQVHGDDELPPETALPGALN